MIIDSIKLVNFRNHSDYKLDFKKTTTKILGKNGCGKTSVLEAIFIAMQGKSFRAVDQTILQRGKDFYRVELEYSDKEKTVVSYDKKKCFLVEGKKYGRLPKKNRHPVILFEPDDLILVNASPTQKRAYFDRFLGQLDEKYSNYLVKYNKALKQRNEVLKSDFVREEDLFSWNVLLAKYGCELRRQRRDLVEQLNQRLTDMYRVIAKNKDEVRLNYEIGVEEVEESFYLKQLEMAFAQDKRQKYTNYGAHRDNYGFYFNKVLAEAAASRGEVRSIVLALKFLEADMLWEKLNERAVILLDDVFSELDQERRKCLIENFKTYQVILTSVESV